VVPAIEKICHRHIQLGRSRLNSKNIFMLVQSGENDERKREKFISHTFRTRISRNRKTCDTIFYMNVDYKFNYKSFLLRKF